MVKIRYIKRDFLWMVGIFTFLLASVLAGFNLSNWLVGFIVMTSACIITMYKIGQLRYLIKKIEEEVF